MTESSEKIIDEYFKKMEFCHSLFCQKVIFEPSTKKEWFYEDDCWCFFEFYCDDNDYVLRKYESKVFGNDCFVRDMSYEIMMLLAYVRLRGVVTVEKSLFNDYVNRYEKEREVSKDLSLEKFNYSIKEKEEIALSRSDKVANAIMGGCLVLVAAVFLLFLIAVISYLKVKFS